MGTESTQGATITIPCEPEIERAALAAIYFGTGNVTDLTAEDFHRPSSKAAFEALAKSEGLGPEARVRAVAAAMPDELMSRRLARALDILGTSYCSETWGIYVDILRRLALRRKLMSVSAKLIGWSQDGAESYEEFRSEAAGYLEETARLIRER